MTENNNSLGNIRETTISKLVGCMRTANMPVSIQYISKTVGINYDSVTKILDGMISEKKAKAVDTSAGMMYVLIDLKVTTKE